MIRALVLKGYGINCEKEMAFACQVAGASVSTAHVQELLSRKVILDSYHLLMLPGGFSFGDELGAGKALANRLTYISEMKERLLDFVKGGKCILGVCNGFQLLVKLGLLPGEGSQEVALAANDSLRFENRWVYHKVYPSPCIFTQGLETLYLPIRHGEGKLVFKNREIHQRLIDNRQIVFRYVDEHGNPAKSYPENPNGSTDAIAGICDPTGRVLGMMAHPEAAIRFFHHPGWTKEKELLKRKQTLLTMEGAGLRLFRNAISAIKENQ